jgi:hypothetical protein
MKEIRLKAKSSSGGAYDVTFQKKGGLLVVFCSCKAGIYGNLCKHRTRLLNGDESMLYNRDDASALREVREWVTRSRYAGLLAEYDSRKKQIEDAKKKERALRHLIERVLVEGIPIGANRS